ncbi:hypothetical protein KGF57_002730 [Candida theae]|uniref:Uncharacterized protein n=1 Tax=Candida theae TaxID=1198502 RepID=A0AAD5BFP7_9ASCO|nr:uncharacterized protein KGF57_002730 [Candida theae]KAI5958373.1 hypothetical protein KGF57_002730 [Candida theae]
MSSHLLQKWDQDHRSSTPKLDISVIDEANKLMTRLWKAIVKQNYFSLYGSETKTSSSKLDSVALLKSQRGTSTIEMIL